MRDEFLAIAETYLEREDMPEDACVALRRWHQQESAAAATSTLFRKEFGSCFSYAVRGTGVNPAWLLMFLRHVAGRLLTQ